MILFRRFSEKSFSSFDIYNIDRTISQLTDKLDKNNISDYGVLTSTPSDYISVSYNRNKVKINIPREMSEYEPIVLQSIYSSVLGARIDVDYDYNNTVVSIISRVTDRDIIKLIRSLISEAGYIIIVPGSSY